MDTLDALSFDDQTNIALETLDSFDLGSLSYLKSNDRTIKDQGFGATDKAQALIKRHIAETAEAIRTHKEASLVGKQGDGVKEFVGVLEGLDDDLVALVALQTGIDAVAGAKSLQSAYKSLGRAIEAEVWANGLRSYDKKLASRLEKAGKRRGSMTNRRQAVRSMAQKAKYEAGPWTDSRRVVAGKWLAEVLLLTPIFVMVEHEDDTRTLTLTEDALAYADKMTAHLLEAHPVALPLLYQPKAWQSSKLSIDCNGRQYDIPLLRKRCKVTQAHLQQAISDGSMQGVFEGINAIQDTAWTINEPIREMIEWCYQNGIEVDGLPSKNDISVDETLKNRGLPERLTDDEWATLPDAQKRFRRKIISGIKEKNRGLIGERMTLDRDLQIASILYRKGDEFWTPYNMDYRGRVYSVPYFGFQRQDYVRSLFMFKEGEALGTEGLYWLKVHVANCGDFGKISKKPFDERVAWVDENMMEIVACGGYPKDCRWWTEADAPFLFLAACMDLAKAYIHPDGPEAYVCRLPASFDGSCSGLQHLAAMTRCLDTASLVNVAPTSQPQDVYQTVADKVAEVVNRDAVEPACEFSDVARLALAYGIDRKLVKRNVMTYSYSSPKFGMVTQQMDDTMRPLQDKVISGKLEAHPFEVPEDTFITKELQTIHMPGKKAAKYLGSVVFDTIEATVKKPAEAMHFLQGIAKALAHEGKPVVWKTPLGLPVVLRYPNMDLKQVSLYLSDRGVKLRTRVTIAEEASGIDKRAASNAIAPSFVHSMDACHLQMVCREAKRQGINSMALVHDSFGCLPSQAAKFRNIIKQEFHRMYSEHDVLADIHRASHEQIHTNSHRIPELPAKGTLDINEVLKAEYAFA